MLSIQAGTVGVSAIFKPCGKNGQCQQMATLFFKINLAFLALDSYFRFAKNGQHVAC